MKKKILLAVSVCALGIGVIACSSDPEPSPYGYQSPMMAGAPAGGGNAMASLPAETQSAMIADMQANPDMYKQQPNESYNAYQSRIGSYAYRWMTPEMLRHVEYRHAVSSAAIQQASSMGLVQARANNLMWDEAVHTERAQANIWDARADTQRSKRSINRDKVGIYSDTTRGISNTVGGVSDTFRNTSSAIDNFLDIFK